MISLAFNDLKLEKANSWRPLEVVSVRLNIRKVDEPIIRY